MATSLKRVEMELSALRAGYISEAAAKIRGLMDKYGVAIDDLLLEQNPLQGSGGNAAPKAGGVRSAAKGSSPLKGRKLDLSPKYKDPKTGQTWTGHGRPPAWISAARDRSRFLIKK